MKPEFTTAVPRSGEVKQLMDIVADALGVPHEHQAWFGSLARIIGTQALRVVRSGRTVVGGGAILDMGHFFGGRRVACGGVTIVGISPEARGTGAAHGLMTHLLREEHARGRALSSLYASTMNLYRKSGYEVAADHVTYELETSAIQVKDRACELVPHHRGATSVFKSFYLKAAREHNGVLDRPPMVWKKVFERNKVPSRRFLVKHKGRLEGYVCYHQQRWTEPNLLSDVWFTTPEAGRRILTLLADQRSTIKHVNWSGGPRDRLVHLMAESRPKVARFEKLLVRIAHVRSAFSERGYPNSIQAELHLEVDDELLPGNAGRWVLSVKDGRGRVKRGGQGRIRLDIRRLAQLYTGYMQPAELRLLGGFDGPAADLAAAAEVFAGPAPWTPDIF